MAEYLAPAPARILSCGIKIIDKECKEKRILILLESLSFDMFSKLDFN